MLQGKRFVIYGLSRLSVRISAQLIAGRADVILISASPAGDPLAAALDRAVSVVPILPTGLMDTLAEIDLDAIDCILALAREDLENLRAAVLIRRTRPDIAVVVRTFDPALADQLESALKVRRAFSVSALSAPVFAVATAGHTVLDTIRIADGEVPIMRIQVSSGAPLAGTCLADIKPRHRCAVLAYKATGSDWLPAIGFPTDVHLQAGDEVLLGGLLSDVLAVAAANSRVLQTFARTTPRRSRLRLGGGLLRPGLRFTLLPRLAAILVTVLIASIFVFERALHLRLVDAIYFVITTATTTGYGDISLKDSPDWLKLFGGGVMLAGGALLGIVFSQLAAVATADRLDELMGRKAARMRGHIIISGLGNLGYRTAKLLRDCGLPVVVIELTHNAHFAAAVRARCPVITGDARLPEDLIRAGVGQCAAVIACTDDDVANIQSCLHARRLNPQARIIARVFDEVLAERMSGAFDIDLALSSSAIAAKAFVGAATDERAFRSIQVDHVEFLACRYTLSAPASSEKIDEWRSLGVRVLAWRSPGGHLEPPLRNFRYLEAGSELVLCGPSDDVREVTRA